MPNRTPPGGVRVAEYQEYVAPNGYGLWKVAATSGWSLLLGTLLAWWTAYQGKGITMKEVQEYDKEYSLFAQHKTLLEQHDQSQQSQIGELRGAQDRNVQILADHLTKFHDDERDITELQGKVKYFGDFVEEQRKLKR